MKQDSVFIIFMRVYSIPVLLAIAFIIVLIVLAYLGIFSTPNTNYECLANSFCQNQTLQFEKYYQGDPANIFCKKNMGQNTSWIIEFKIDNWEILNQKYPECQVKK